MKTKIAIEKYFTHLEEEKYSKYTLTLYRINMAHFLKVAPNKVEDISKQVIKKFTAQLQKAPITYKTKNYRLITLRNFLKYTAKEIELDYSWNNIELFSDRTDSGKIHVPHQKVTTAFLQSIVGKSKKMHCLSPDQQLMSDRRSDAVVNTLYATGLRISELVSLERHDIFPAGLDLKSKKETAQITIIGKGSKVRLIFINKKTLEIIKKYLKLRNDNCEALFASIYKSPSKIKQRLVQTMVENRVSLLEECGIIPPGTLISPHTLRHAYATHLIASGASLMAVKDLMGHASITTTQRYLHLSNASLKNEYDKVYG